MERMRDFKKGVLAPVVFIQESKMRKGKRTIAVIAAVLGFLVLLGSAKAELVAHWKFDEVAGDIAYDSAGSNDGTVYGAQWTGGALDFDGLNDYVRIPDDYSLTPGSEITISFWIYSRGGQNAGIYKYASCPNESYSPGNSRAYHFSVSGDGKAGLTIFSSVSTYDSIAGDVVVPFNQWHHVAGTFNQGNAAIYIDGQLDKSETLSVTSIMNDAQPLIIGGFWSYCGADTFCSRLNGIIDDVRIYNRALISEEIHQLYLRKQAHNPSYDPYPYYGTIMVDPNVILHWEPGDFAGFHDVYLGTDYNDVNDANTTIYNPNDVYRGRFEPNYFDPCGLDTNTTYYWRVDEVNEPNIWKGNIWQFKTKTAEPFILLSQDEFYFENCELDSQILTISNGGVQPLNWTITYDCNDCNWLTVAPLWGSCTSEPNEVTLSVDKNGLEVNREYDCNLLIISDPCAFNNPQIVVYLNLECFPCDHHDYYDWEIRRKPTRWCNPRQCHGDADGEMETRGKQDFWVGYPDLDIFLAGFPIPTYTYVDEATHPWIAADFDHEIEMRGKGYYYVGFSDLDIFLASFPIPDDGIEPNCLQVQ